MFDLERSILKWRGEMLSAVEDREIVDELESHLREDWARRVELGESEEHAFEGAVERIGEGCLLKNEFAKSRGRTWAWLRKMKLFFARAFDSTPSINSFSPAARWTLELARLEAPRLKHGFVGTEHVLLGLLALEDGVVSRVSKKMGVNHESVRQEVESWVSGFASSKIPGRIAYTPRVRRSLRLAAREAQAAKGGSVGAEHILLGLVLEGEGVAGRVLRDLGVTAEATRAAIAGEVDRERAGNDEN